MKIKQTTKELILVLLLAICCISWCSINKIDNNKISYRETIKIGEVCSINEQPTLTTTIKKKKKITKKKLKKSNKSSSKIKN